MQILADITKEGKKHYATTTEMENNLLNLIYPVNTGFIAYDDTDYSSHLGFTWEKTCIGRVPVGKDVTQTEFDAVGKTGGHKLLQEHFHVATTRTTTYGVGSQDAWRCMSFVGTNSDYAQTVNTGSTGGGDSQNLQPYQVVNYWKRTA